MSRLVRISDEAYGLLVLMVAFEEETTGEHVSMTEVVDAVNKLAYRNRQLLTSTQKDGFSWQARKGRAARRRSTTTGARPRRS
jgi:hypothetical protein